MYYKLYIYKLRYIYLYTYILCYYINVLQIIYLYITFISLYSDDINATQCKRKYNYKYTRVSY